MADDESDATPDSELDDAKEEFQLCVENESENRRDALDDLRFARLADQWPERVRKQRDREGRPCLTINRLPSFIRQVVNDARQNKPEIKVHPADSDADVQVAEIYNGLIRNIEAVSKADIAYDTALDFAVTMGFGYFRINTGYACDDTFDLDLLIQRIANPFSVYGDPFSTEADSSDWNISFVTDSLWKSEFKRKYKGAEEVNWSSNGYDGLAAPWLEDEKILVAEYFKREPIKKTILLLTDQTVVDEATFKEQKAQYDAMGISVAGSRITNGYKVTQRIMTGAEVLETNPWAGKYIPIVPVYGDEVNVEGKRYLRSLVRDAKDPQRMLNYWRTTGTELVALSPKTPYIGPKGSFVTDIAKWQTANTDTHAFIQYDQVGNGAAPERQPFAGVPAGALQEALNASDDIKSIIGLFDASLGAKSNETSGRAILARQSQGDISSFHFIDNLSRSIEHAGRILIDLIPKVYNGQRIIRVLGPQKEVSTVPLNQPVPVPGPNGQPQTDTMGQVMTQVFDLGAGKYDLTVETGPSYSTQREEAANQMIELIRAFPAAAPVIGDLLVKNLDWPGADEIAQRLQGLQQQQGIGGGGPPQQGAPAASGTHPAVQAAQVQVEAQQAQADQGAENAKLSLQAQQAQVTAQLESRKLDIMEFEAATKRMEAAARVQSIQQPAQDYKMV